MTERTKENIMFGFAAVVLGLALVLTISHAMDPEHTWWDTIWYGFTRFAVACATIGLTASAVGLSPPE